jgi:apolipoprotein N-acyltransferase
MDDAVTQGAELVVTPETVLPGGLLDPAARAVLPEPFGGTLLGEQRRAGVPMLAGCTTLRGLRDEGDRLAWDGVLNSVLLLVDGEAVGPRYDKLRPTPFGETLPYVQSLPWLRDLILQIGLGASGMDFGLDRGSEVVAFEVPVRGGAVTVTTPICFESSMAPTVRKLVNGAREQGRPTELLAVVTNDGWFGWFDAGRRMHLLQARWRCVEHRLPMVRTANTGVSALIDHRGRVLASLPARRAGALVGDVLLGTGVPTLYQRIGDAFGAGCAVVTLLAFIAGIVAGRRNAPAGRAEAAERDADGQGATT